MSKAEESSGDTWAQAKEHIDGCKTSDPDTALTLVCFYQGHNPGSLFQKKQVQDLESDGLLSYCTVYYVDAEADHEAFKELGLSATPALMVYWGTKAVSVTRPGYDSGVRVMGCMSKDTISEMVRQARKVSLDGGDGVVLDS